MPFRFDYARPDPGALHLQLAQSGTTLHAREEFVVPQHPLYTLTGDWLMFWQLQLLTRQTTF